MTDQDTDSGVKTDVIWRGLPLDAYRIMPKKIEVFRGSLGESLSGG